MEFTKFIRSTIREYLNESLSLIRGVGKNDSGKGLYLTDDLDVAKFYGDTIKRYNISGKSSIKEIS